MLSSDYFSTHGKDYVVLVDRFSNWPIVFESRGGAPGLVRELRSVLSTFGALQTEVLHTQWQSLRSFSVIGVSGTD